jgi:serpin B
MTANGAAGSTRSQMLEVLHIDSLATYNAGMAALTQAIEHLAGPVTLPDGSRDRIELATADQLFGDRGMQWRDAFLTVLAKQYGAGMRGVDFLHDPEAARVLINAWTSTQTHGRIPQLLPKGIVDEMTRLALVNALYFKAPWQTPFDKGTTRSTPFTRSDGSKVAAEMMHHDPESPAVYLAGAHFDAVAELLTGGTLTRRGEPGVDVTMPRWSFRVPTDLGDALQQLGMSQAFGDGADFSAMTQQERLHLSFVLHQTFIAVDEDGTEAAAATAVGVADSAIIGGHELVLDRPFLFVVHDVAHGTPLFVGRVADPS